VSARLGLRNIAFDEFATHAEPGEAVMTAMTDLSALGLVRFQNVAYGNELTQDGRDVLAHGFAALHDACLAIPVSAEERAFLARLYIACEVYGDGWTDLGVTDPAMAYPADDDREPYAVRLQRMQFLQDLRAKKLTWHQLGDTCRPTYISAVILTETGSVERRGGLVDWSEPQPGFERVQDRLAQLKVRLAAAATDDDLSDIGRRCRDLYADAIDVVFAVDMVPSGREVPSRQDAEERLGYYLDARTSGGEFAELRGFVRTSLKLANARTHSFRTGRASAVAAAQGVISFLRVLEAIERTNGSSGSG
jgi:hypothetical protein